MIKKIRTIKKIPIKKLTRTLNYYLSRNDVEVIGLHNWTYLHEQGQTRGITQDNIRVFLAYSTIYVPQSNLIIDPKTFKATIDHPSVQEVEELIRPPF